MSSSNPQSSSSSSSISSTLQQQQQHHHHHYSLATISSTCFLETHAFGDMAIGVSQGLAFTFFGQPFDAVRLNSQARHLNVTQMSTARWARELYRREGVRGFWHGWSSPAVGFTFARGAQSFTMGVTRDYFILQKRAELQRWQEEEAERLRVLSEEKERSRRWWEKPIVALGSTILMDITGVEPPGPPNLSNTLFPVQDQIQQQHQQQQGQHPPRKNPFGSRMQNDMQLEVWKNVLCAAVGAATYTTIHTPFDLVRVRMSTQTQYSHRVYTSGVDCAYQLWECGGVAKLYLGYRAALARDIPAQIIVFGLYGILRPVLPQDENNQVRARHAVLLGGLVGMAQWTVVIPLDCIKTRIQTAPDHFEQKPGWFEAGRRIHSLYGWRGFYAGLPAALAKAFVGNAALFASTEFAASQVSAYQHRVRQEKLIQSHMSQQQQQQQQIQQQRDSSSSTSSSSSSSSSSSTK